MTNYRDIGAVTYPRLSTRLMSYSVSYSWRRAHDRRALPMFRLRLLLTTYHLPLTTYYLLLATDY